MTSLETISDQKKEIIKNLYASGIPTEFIASQVGMKIKIVASILEETS
jgi:hypothetical protein